MKIGHFGSCLSAIPSAHLVDIFGCEEVFRIHHNRSDQFLRYFVDQSGTPLDYSWLNGFLKAKPEFASDAAKFIENQYLPTIGFENTLRHKVTQSSNFIDTLRNEKVDIIMFDNFMDVVSRLLYPRKNRQTDKTVFFPSHFYENDREIDNYFAMDEYIQPQVAAENWIKIYRFFRKLQPEAKIYFITWSHSTSRDNPERFKRILSFYKALVSLAETEDLHVIPPMDVPDDLTAGPDDWYHMAGPIYKGLAGYIYAHATGNMDVHARPNKELIAKAVQMEAEDADSMPPPPSAEDLDQMPFWDLLSAASEETRRGRLEVARSIFFLCAEKWGDLPAAKSWALFGLMNIDVTTEGFNAAQKYLEEIAASEVNWSGKLQVLLYSLQSASSDDANIDWLLRSANSIIARFKVADLDSEDILLNMSRRISQEMLRLSTENHDEFTFKEVIEPEYQLVGEVAANPAKVSLPTYYNFLTSKFKDFYACGPAQSGIKYYNIGKGYLLRMGTELFLLDGRKRLTSVPHGGVPEFIARIIENKIKNMEASELISGKTLFIADKFTQLVNYCHWTLDAMPRILGASLQGVPFENVLGSHAIDTAFQADTLKHVLPDGVKYYGFSSDVLVEIEDLTFADTFADRLNHPCVGGNAELISGLRKRMLPEVSGHAQRRIYVPRKISRYVFNESDLKALLAKYDFDIVNCDGLSVDQQVETFSNASAVIAPHGAALTNLVYCKPGTKVMELFPPVSGSTAYMVASAACGLDYSLYIDKISMGENVGVDASVLNVPITVDLDFIETWLKAL